MRSRTIAFTEFVQFTEALVLLRLLAAKNHSRHGVRHFGRTDSPARLRLRLKHLFLCVPAEINPTTWPAAILIPRHSRKSGYRGKDRGDANFSRRLVNERALRLR